VEEKGDEERDKLPGVYHLLGDRGRVNCAGEGRGEGAEEEKTSLVRPNSYRKGGGLKYLYVVKVCRHGAVQSFPQQAEERKGVV